MIDSKKSFTFAKFALVTGTFLLPGLFVIACTDTRRGLGEQCLKGEDCVSNLCVAQQCASDPPLVTGTGTPTTDAGPDVVVIPPDASDSGSVTDAPDDSASATDARDANGDD